METHQEKTNDITNNNGNIKGKGRRLSVPLRRNGALFFQQQDQPAQPHGEFLQEKADKLTTAVSKTMLSLFGGVDTSSRSEIC